MRRRSFRPWAWLLLCLPLAAACGSSLEVTREPSRPSRPPWLGQLPSEPGSQYVVGTATGADSLENAQNAALKDALGKIGAFIRTTIESEFVQVLTNTDQSVKDRLRATAEAQVSKAVVVDTFHEKITRRDGAAFMERFEAYTLVKIAMADVEKEIRRQEHDSREKSKIAYGVFQKARALEAARDFRRARRLYDEAAKLLNAAQVPVALADMEVKSTQEFQILLSGRQRDVVGQLRRIGVVPMGATVREPAFMDHLAQRLAQHGFTVKPLAVDAARLRSLEPAAVRSLDAGGSPTIVAVDAGANFSSQTLGNYFYSVDGGAKVFDSTSGELMLTVPIRARGNHQTQDTAIRRAFAEAAKDLGDRLAKELLAKEGAD